MDAYNADPVAWDIFPETLATSIRNSYQPEALAASAGMAGARTTLDAFQKTGGARLAQRVEFRAERVAALMAATHEGAQALLAAWNQELAK